MDTPKKESLASRLPIPGSRRGFKGFFSEARAEMTKVTWPTPRETTRLTGVVAAVIGMVVGLLFVLSLIVDFLMNIIVKGGH